MADRHRRREERRRRGGGQADPRARSATSSRRTRSRTASPTPRSRTRSGNYILPTIPNTSAAAVRDQGPGGPRDLDDQLAEPAGVPDRVADVPGHLQGSVQVGWRKLVDRERAEEVPHLRVRPRPADARLRLGPAAVCAAAVGRWWPRTRPSWPSWSATGHRSRRDGLVEASATTTAPAGRSVLERSAAGRLPDRVLQWGLTVLAALILALLAYFFIRLIGESQHGAEQVRPQLRVRQRLGRLAQHLPRRRAGLWER